MENEIRVRKANRANSLRNAHARYAPARALPERGDRLTRKEELARLAEVIKHARKQAC